MVRVRAGKANFKGVTQNRSRFEVRLPKSAADDRHPF
eukprot:SAG22_NODE_21328_length_258_cov_0.641509_2_plen_36_part_01